MTIPFGYEFPHFHDCAEVIESSDHLASIKMNVDTKKHIYLIDHVFGDKCFVPATMIMEIFLESALWYERSVDPETGFFPNMLLNLNIERAIAMDPGDSLEITVNILSAERTQESCKQKIEIVSYRRARNGKIIGMRLNASSEVVLSFKEAVIESFAISDLHFDHYSIMPSKWYDYLFPSLLNCFHGSTGDVAISQDGNWLKGIYNCADKESAFIKGQKGDFVSSPLGNDTCLQYAVFLARYVASVGRLPVGGHKIVFSRSYPKNEAVTVRIKLLDINEDTAELDIISFDRHKRPVFYAERFIVRTSPFQSPLNKEELFEFFNQYSTKTTSKIEA